MFMNHSTTQTNSQVPSNQTSLRFEVITNQEDCPICLEVFDLFKIIPMMICLNQHSCCQHCLMNVYQRTKCPICDDHLIPRTQVRKNRLIYDFLLELLRDNGKNISEYATQKYPKKLKTKKTLRHKKIKKGKILQGEYKNGQLHGECKIITDEGAKFKGKAENKKIQGTFTTLFGDKVEGVFDIDSLMGTGCRKTYSNGNIFEGRIEELKADGYGVMTFENGNKIQGGFYNDELPKNGHFIIDGNFQVQLKNKKMYIPQLNSSRKTFYYEDDSSSSSSSRYSRSDS